MTKDRALVGVVTALALLVLAVGCGLVSDQGRQEAKTKVEDLQKKVESKGQQARQEVKKKVEAGQEDLKKKVDEVQTKMDDVQKKVTDLQKKVDELLKKVVAQEQQDQKK